MNNKVVSSNTVKIRAKNQSLKSVRRKSRVKRRGSRNKSKNKSRNKSKNRNCRRSRNNLNRKQ